MSGDILLLLLCAFVAWTVRTSSQKFGFQSRQPSLDKLKKKVYVVGCPGAQAIWHAGLDSSPVLASISYSGTN
jgi:hypothetical protein